jgi:hypothetical protein
MRREISEGKQIVDKSQISNLVQAFLNVIQGFFCVLRSSSNTVPCIANLWTRRRPTILETPQNQPWGGYRPPRRHEHSGYPTMASVCPISQTNDALTRKIWHTKSCMPRETAGKSHFQMMSDCAKIWYRCSLVPSLLYPTAAYPTALDIDGAIHETRQYDGWGRCRQPMSSIPLLSTTILAWVRHPDARVSA